jgi:cob(I)alamin adenosyltransferase
MAFEDFKTKENVVVVYTGESKGKTSASIGLMCRALGRGWRVAYVQFIKHWEVGEHTFIHKIQPVFGEDLVLYKGGKGFYNAGDISAKGVSDDEHKAAAQDTYKFALKCAKSGKYDLVVCDEINNAVHDGLLKHADLEELIDMRAANTSLCLTGRNFPQDLLTKVDIATNMTKIKHHFDDKFLANKGIDY